MFLSSPIVPEILKILWPLRNPIWQTVPPPSRSPWASNQSPILIHFATRFIRSDHLQLHRHVFRRSSATVGFELGSLPSKKISKIGSPWGALPKTTRRSTTWTILTLDVGNRGKLTRSLRAACLLETANTTGGGPPRWKRDSLLSASPGATLPTEFAYHLLIAGPKGGLTTCEQGM